MKYTILSFLFAICIPWMACSQSSEAKMAYNNAVRAYNAKDFVGAISLLEEFANNEPEFIQAQRLMAELYKKTGDEEKTRGYYKRLLDHNPNQAEIWYSYALTYLREGDEESAKAAFNKVLVVDENHAKALRQLEYLKGQQEKNDQATASVEPVPVSTPEPTPEKKPASSNTLSKDTAIKYANKGIGFYNEKSFQEAAMAFDKSLEGENPSAKLYSYAARAHMHIGNADKAIDYLKEALEQDTDAGDFYYYLSKAYEMKGVDNLREKYATMAANRGFKGTDETFDNGATRHYNAGVDYYHDKKYAEAVKEYLRAIDKNPNKVRYHYNLAMAYKAMKRYKDAMASAESAIAVDGTYPHAYNLMGDLLYDSQKYRKAATYYQEVINLGEDTYNTHLNVAYCFDRLASYKQALTYFATANELKPQHQEIEFALAMAYFKAGDMGASKEHYSNYVETYPEDIRGLKNYSTVCARTGDFETGLKYALKWVDIAPHEAEAYCQVGDMLANMSRHDEADKYRRKAKSLGVSCDPMRY